MNLTNFAELSFIDQLIVAAQNPDISIPVIVGGSVIGWALYNNFVKGPPQDRNPWTFGRAHFATLAEIKALTTAPGKGIITDGSDRAIFGQIGGQLIGPEVHGAVFSRTGGGKGVTVVIPTLLLCKNSIVCNDIKGENVVVTARRRREMGQRVIIIDPYNESQQKTASDGFNPLDFIINGDEDAVTEARFLADTIFKETPAENPFFSDGARGLISTFILYVCAKFSGEDRSLVKVRQLMCLPGLQKLKLFQEMLSMEDFGGAIAAGAATILEIAGIPTDVRTEKDVKIQEEGTVPVQDETVVNPEDKGKKGETTQKAPKQNNAALDLYGTANIALQWVDDPKVQRILKKSTFEMNMLQYIPTTVYIVLAPKRLRTCVQLMRLIYTYALSSAETQVPPPRAKELGLKRGKLLFLMDEFAQLGTFDVVKQAMPLVRGYKVRFLIINQGVKQLEEFYKIGATEFINGCDKLFIGAADKATAELISEHCDMTTVKVKSYDYKGHATTSWQGAKLITTGDVLHTPTSEPFLVKDGMNGIKLKSVVYYKEKRFKGMFDRYMED